MPLTLDEVLGNHQENPAQGAPETQVKPDRFLSLEDVIGKKDTARLVEAEKGSVVGRAKRTAGDVLESIGLGSIAGRKLPPFEGVSAEVESTAETVGRKQTPFVPEGTRAASATVRAMPGVSLEDKQKVTPRGVGALGTVGDMTVGLVANLALAPFQLILQGKHAKAGLPRAEAALEAEKDVREILERSPQAVIQPFATIAKSFGQEEAFRDNPVNWIMDRLMKAVETGSETLQGKTGIPAAETRWATNFLMNMAGAAGVRAGLQKAAQARVAEAAKPALRAQELRQAGINSEIANSVERVERLQAEASASLERPGPPSEARAAAFEARRRAQTEAAERSQLNRVGIPDEPAALEPSPPRPQVFTERVVRQSDLQAEARQMADPVRQAELAIAASRARIAEESAQRRAQAELDAEAALTPSKIARGEGLSPVEQAIAKAREMDVKAPVATNELYAQRIANKAVKGEQLTPSETAVLRAVADQLEIPKGQKGAIDPDLLKKIAVTAGTFAIALPLVQAAVNYFNPDHQVSLQKWINTGNPRVDPNAPDRDITPRPRRGTSDRPGVSPPEEPQYRQFTPPRKTDLIEASAGLAAAGMVFGRKGMPHPKMIADLALPLKARLANIADEPRFANDFAVREAAKEPLMQWADRAVAKWLQKPDMGEGIRDIQVPLGEGTASLGSLFDVAVGDQPAGVYKGGNKRYKVVREEAALFKNVPDSEPVFDLSEIARMPNDRYAARAIKDYLSHVGDYLRTNVPPEKLANYDLPRAIRETAANDTRIAKQLEAEVAKQTAQLPAVREYPNGQRWVELKVPEKLTEEQARGVRPLTVVERARYEKTREAHIALNSSGKPIVNNYTKEVAMGRTPEEAWLAGRLAEEGNQMGHCVGCYVDDVASGASRIFSLRDTKGQSHVTVEVVPEKGRAPNAEGVLEPRTGETITQIKGKQNRAPNEEYLPAVQDFVRNPPEGKAWAGVEDLGNARLAPSSDVFLKDGRRADELQGTPRYLTNEEVQRVLDQDANLFGNSQRGSADPALVSALGLSAAGAVIGSMLASDNKLTGAALGAAGVLGFAKLARDGNLRDLDSALGVVSTRIRDISPPVLGALRHYTRVVGERTDAALDAVTPLLQGAKHLGKEEKALLQSAVFNQEGAKGAEAVGLSQEWAGTQALLKVFEDKLKSLGRFREGITEYYPRVVSDVKGLKEHLGVEHAEGIDKVLAKASREKALKDGTELSPVEQSIIINNYLKSELKPSGLPGHARVRRVEEVTPEMMRFYEPMEESLLRYIRAATEDIAKAEFFGKSLRNKTVEGRQTIDLDASIGELLQKELTAGRLKSEGVLELKSMLKSIFENAESSPSGWIQDIRNVSNAGLLGSFHSAATQLGDSMMTVYHHGLRPTLEAVKDALTGNREISTKDFGLTNHIMEELGKARLSGQALQTVLKWNGFRAIDQFAKNLNLNAGLIKNRRLAESEAGQLQLAKKYKEMVGEDFDPLFKDLQEGKLTERVKDLLYSELSDAQPLNKLEVPQYYLDNPNQRILYQMHTYMIKQLDVVRRDAYQQIEQGNWKTGYRNLAGLGAALALSNVPGDAVKDFLSGRPLNVSPDMMENLWKNFGVNRYAMDTLKKGDLKTFAINAVAPSLGFAQSALKDPVKHIPGLGRAYYDRYMGGNDNLLLQKEIRRKREEREKAEQIDPSLRAERLLRESLRREQLLERAREAR